ncbi:hypothetical protein OESDEN_09317 [Oesophagostomum dentatum]|uniref:Uncharacterized protein n=1 Tax=Oesophagostomum dentatum TaxID=61180 RepID=A0A0B1T3V0_OESDE|nr:hypothetical protein OESDEN_09317 [Oesophagostomum dentatum]
MAGRPPSRETTSFPPGNTTFSSSSSELMGAFGTLNLDHEPSPGTEMQQIPRPTDLWRPPTAQRVILPPLNQPQEPLPSTATHSSRGSHSYGNQHHTIPLLRDSHAPSTNGSTVSTRRKYHNLSDVVTLSGDSADLARNLGDYINDKIPYGLSIAILIVFSIIAFMLILVGTFNLPFCRIQPMIPIWLLVTGILIILSATLRIYRLIPSPRERSRNLTLHLCRRGTEALFFLVNVVWLTLGNDMHNHHYADSHYGYSFIKRSRRKPKVMQAMRIHI